MPHSKFHPRSLPDQFRDKILRFLHDFNLFACVVNVVVWKVTAEHFGAQKSTSAKSHESAHQHAENRVQGQRAQGRGCRAQDA